MSKKIIKFTAENVKRLSCVTIEPTGNVITIGGRNGQGKTSTLDAIAMALGGAAEVCSKPVRKGEKNASIELDLGDIIVRRRFTEAGGSSLEIKNKDGAVYPSPQTMLDKLTGKISFDPLSFTRLEGRKQLEALKRVVGLDLSEMEARRARVFAERADINRDGKAAKVKWDAMPVTSAPDEEVNIAALSEKLKAAEATNREIVESEEALAKADDDVADARKMLTALERQLADWKDKLSDRVLVAAMAHKAHEKLEAAPTEPLYAEIANAEEVNKAVRAKRQKIDAGKELDVLRDKSAALTKQLEAIDAEKEAALAAATFPVPGLSFGVDGITFNGMPFDQCSAAEQLRVSVAMGLSMNPGIKVLLVRDGSLLDADSLKLIADMAEAADGQVWIEVVSNTGEGCTVVIEDGAVKGAVAAAAVTATATATA